MPYVTVGEENNNDIELYYEDHGEGDAVVLVHGWPLSGASWEKQTTALLAAGFRVITYDRRGFGQSSKPAFGYDYGTMAADLNELLDETDVEDATLVGFSMGGGEVARYLGEYGSDRIARAAFISAVTPFLLKRPDNPEGVDGNLFEGIQQAIAADRPAMLSKFIADFYDFDVYKGKLISEQVLQANFNVAAGASPIATRDCVTAFGTTDFRDDLKKIDVPTLVIHGDADRIVPYASAGKRMPDFVKDCKLVTVAGGPHGLIWTHAEQANLELLKFLGYEGAAKSAGASN
jgi:non-heme chloroperoxidase